MTRESFTHEFSGDQAQINGVAVLPLHSFEHVQYGQYRIPNNECNVDVGTDIYAKFIHRNMRSKGTYICERAKVFMKDNNYTYISIY